MLRRILIRPTLFLALAGIVSCSVTPAKEEIIKRMAMSKKELDKIQQLHYGWYVQAVSALLGAIGKEHYMKMDRNNRRAFVACLDNIDKEHDLQSGAKCLVKAFDKQLVKSFPYALHRPYYDFVDVDLKHRGSQTKKKLMRKAVEDFAKAKAAQLLKQHFTKKSENLSRTKFISPKRRITYKRSRSEMLPRRNQKLKSILQKRHRRVRRNVLSLYRNKEAIEEAKRADSMDSPYRPINMKSTPPLLSRQKSPVRVMTDVLGTLWRAAKNRTKADQTSIRGTYMRLLELQNKVLEAKRSTLFKHRMLDMVVGKDNPLRRRKSFTERFRDLMPKKAVDESVYGLVDAVSRHTKDVNQQFLSPRFLPLLPDKYTASKPMLSPDLFPLYKDDSDNSMLPIPEVLEKSGLNSNDRESILELIMDVAGVNDVIEKSMKLLKKMKEVGLGADLASITSAVDRVFDELSRSLDSEQRRDMAGRQYSFLNRDQMISLYGENGIFNTTQSELPFNIDEFSSLTRSRKEEALRNTIRLLAEDSRTLHRRHKRTITLDLLRPKHLAPFVFAPSITTLTILGPVILSPNAFSPSILSPLLLSPPVISPQVGNPMILSPYVLGPNTISGAAFNAYVFTPYVLSPNFISPYVLSPLILSPYVLCPDIISPTILSGVVLSPSVASPSVFTESALSVNVLSPSFLS